MVSSREFSLNSTGTRSPPNDAVDISRHPNLSQTFSDFAWSNQDRSEVSLAYTVINTHMHWGLTKVKEIGEIKIQTWRTRGNAKSHEYIHAAPHHQPWCWQIHNFPLWRTCCEQDSPSEHGQTQQREVCKRSKTFLITIVKDNGKHRNRLKRNKKDWWGLASSSHVCGNLLTHQLVQEGCVSDEGSSERERHRRW